MWGMGCGVWGEGMGYVVKTPVIPNECENLFNFYSMVEQCFTAFNMTMEMWGV